MYRKTRRWRPYTFGFKGGKHCACWKFDMQQGSAEFPVTDRSICEWRFVSKMRCCRISNRSNTSLNETLMLVHSIFDNVWTEVWKHLGLRKQFCLIMVALCNRADHYIFILFHYSFFFVFPRLISAVGDWMSTILPHMVWP